MKQFVKSHNHNHINKTPDQIKEINKKKNQIPTHIGKEDFHFICLQRQIFWGKKNEFFPTSTKNCIISMYNSKNNSITLAN